MSRYSKQNDSAITRLLGVIHVSNIHESNKTLGPPANGRASKYKLEKDSISRDLTSERPLYVLSAYGPGRDAPLQLFGGRPREQSFEELRTRHYELAAQGRQHEAIQEAQALVENAEQQMKTALGDLDGAIKYICDGENNHPNRIDTCNTKGQPLNTVESSSVSQPAFSQASQGGSFGGLAVPPAFGQRSSTPVDGQSSTTPGFGRPSAPAFGQPSAPTSAFGQTPGAALGKSSGSVFGQPSRPAAGFGQTSSAAFGQPAALGRPTTSFGQTSSALGQTSSQASAFGQPSSQTSAFGKPTPISFAGPSQGMSEASETSRNLFRAPSQSAPFAQSNLAPGAGTVAAPSENSNFDPFNLPTKRATDAEPRSSQPAVSTANPFGVSAQQSAGGVSKPASVSTPNPFGQPSVTTSSQSIPTANAAVTRRPSVQLTNGVAGQRDAQGKLKTWMGKEVLYIDDVPHFRNNSQDVWQRIWFADGPPTFTKTEELPETAYDAATKEKYSFAMEHGRFGNGGIPLMPPRKDWCNWEM